MTCTAWSLTSAFSAYRCRHKPTHGGLCQAHLAYPDRPSLPQPTDAPKEKKK